MTDRYRTRSPIAAIGVVTALVVAGIASWGVVALAVFAII